MALNENQLNCQLPVSNRWAGLRFGQWSLATALLAALVLIPAATVNANGSWGSGGSSGGSFGSSGGSWGSRGGLLNGRRPVRNLLSRIGGRFSGGGSSGSHGSFGSSGGGCLGRRNMGSFGSGGSSGYSSYGSHGASYGSSGGYVAAVNCAPAFVGNSGSTQFLATAQSAAPIETSYSMPAGASSFQLQQSYPVGDYGLNPGYPVYQSMPGGQMIGGATMSDAFGGTIIPSADGFIQDGGSIVPMLDGVPASGVPGGTPGVGGSGADPVEPPSVDEDGATQLNASLRASGIASRAILNLSVPETARVFINGQLTKTPGTVRSYASDGLDPNREYHYQVKVEIERDGKTLVRSKMVTLRPGFDRLVAMDFTAPPVTRLALEVPSDAKVKLDGVETALTGASRNFATTALKDGLTLNNYQIEVEFEVDGKPVIEVKSIDLVAGDFQSVAFGDAAVAKAQRENQRFAAK